MKDCEEIIEKLESQIRHNIDCAGNDNELLNIIKVQNMHLELLAEFMEYAGRFEIAKSYEVFMTRNWIHFTHGGVKVFVLSWTYRLGEEERMELIAELKNSKMGLEKIKYYLMIWGMNETFEKLALSSKMEIENNNVIVKDNSQVIELMSQYVSCINND